MPTILFELRQVSYSYLGKFPALREINIDILKGEAIAFLGANGSGKSTLMHILDGLIFPDKGSIKAFGRQLDEQAFTDVRFSREFRSKVGLVFQNPDVQLFCPTVREDILFGPLQLGIAHDEIKKRLEKLVEILQLQNLLERAPHQLSIGEKRKVAIASTLIIEPEVIILDEPTAGLDPLTTRHIVDILVDAHAAGKTIIISTHDLHVMEEMADTVFILSAEKKLVCRLTPQELIKDEPLLRANNLLHIHRHRHKGALHVHPHLHLEHHQD